MSNKNKRIVFMPKYMSEFKCIGPECEDTCCSGWDVFIDENTFKEYLNTENERLKELLRNKIIKNAKEDSFLNYGMMILKNEKRCPFLNEKLLCDIHGGFGEERLCITCNYYPRIINIVDDVYEKSAVLSCPEACRLALLNEEKMEFVEQEEYIDEEKIEIRRIIDTEAFDGSDNSIQFFWDVRELTINLLQNRDFSLDERLKNLTNIYEEIQQCIDEGDIESILDVVDNYFDMENINRQNNIENEQGILELIKKLCDIEKLKIIKNERLMECILEFKEGLNIKEHINNDTIKEYINALDEYYNPYFKKREYILENYLVNSIFKDLFPFNKVNDFIKSLEDMKKQINIIKTYLVGIAAYHKEEFNEEHVVKLVQSFSKTLEHNPEYKDKLLCS